MKAKVKQDYRWDNLRAFSGSEFVKYEYRTVPAGCEKEAQAHPALEIEAAAPVKKEVEPKLEYKQPEHTKSSRKKDLIKSSGEEE